jgi:hypothetical protein
MPMRRCLWTDALGGPCSLGIVRVLAWAATAAARGTVVDAAAWTRFFWSEKVGAFATVAPSFELPQQMHESGSPPEIAKPMIPALVEIWVADFVGSGCEATNEESDRAAASGTL